MKHYAISISDGGKFVVAVEYSGNVVFGDGVEVNEASALFWEKVRELATSRPIPPNQVP